MPKEDLPPGSRSGEGKKIRNRLALEKSPYLLQHAANPVDWYPWGEEAFSRALEEDKPVFLSVGYATCHWCHVMAHESFEDETVASLLNRYFVCIKVDREERPDLDSVYMAACRQMTGQGGWPLTIFMTPDRRPFYAATYIPKERRGPVPGLLELLPRIAEVWREDRDHVVVTADRILAEITRPEVTDPSYEPDERLLDAGFEELAAGFDPDYGGFGHAPKFPAPHTLLFLLRYWHRTGKKQALAMVERTLGAIRYGGICDQVGGGFHRYSIDVQWRVPHFEKMLYDQALLLMACSEAFQATGNPVYRETADGIVTYVLRDLTSPAGAFFSAEDADSPGGEGAFYLWSAADLTDALGQEDGEYAARVFNATRTGNYSGSGKENGNGKNILWRSGMPVDLVSEVRMTSIRARLLAARERRARPLRDDKVLADWNGLFIAALAQSARVSGKASHLVAAERAMKFVLGNLRTPEGALLHRYRDGEAAIPGFADDYVFVILALIELYESSFDTGYLSAALDLNRYFLNHFGDPDHGGFFMISGTSEVTLFRKKEWYDGAIPSANSVAFANLLRLSRLTGDPGYASLAMALSREAGRIVSRSPSAYTGFLSALDFAVGPTTEIVLAGNPGAEDTEHLVGVLRAGYLPRCTVLFRPVSGDRVVLDRIAPFSSAMIPKDGRAAAYVCSGNTCSPPITEPEKLAAFVNGNIPGR
ncbi:thioredoxin domain-containing protein [Methanoregula sp.]|uniref:thioredoxin domain-containing protein n=1 Tax=Methanoregula sp. TaxID=2052170 RepID=UPI003C72F695